jgi:large subunit ribosomal protein L17
MKKKVFGRKLSRSRPAREALFASLIRAMIINGRIETTRAKAKAIQGDLEKIVTLAKKGGLASYRKVLAFLDNDKKVTNTLFQNTAKAFLGRASGYTRLISLPRRVGDNAQMVRVEWTEKVAAEDRKGKDKSDKSEKETKSTKKPEVKKKDSSLKSSNSKSES